jgi:hypothetical protein
LEHIAESQQDAPESLADLPEPKLILYGVDENDARIALRAFLQRGETRLATMHAIAAAFIGGAGLLALIPIVLRDAFENYVKVIYGQFHLLGFREPCPWGSSALIVATLLILFAMYETVKQLVFLYFISPPKDEARVPNVQPGALCFAYDEPGPKKDEDQGVLADLYAADRRINHWPASSTKQAVLNQLYVKAKFEYIVEKSDPGFKRFLRYKFTGSSPLHPYRQDTECLISNEQLDASAVSEMNGAFELAGVVDRSLHDQVATLESVLARFNIGLRVLMIRYVKALLLTVITVVMFMIPEGLIRDPLRDPAFSAPPPTRPIYLRVSARNSRQIDGLPPALRGLSLILSSRGSVSAAPDDTPPSALWQAAYLKEDEKWRARAYQESALDILAPFCIGLAWIAITVFATHWPIAWVTKREMPDRHPRNNLGLNETPSENASQRKRVWAPDPHFFRFESIVVAFSGLCVASLGTAASIYLRAKWNDAYVWQHSNENMLWAFALAFLFAIAAGSVVIRIYGMWREGRFDIETQRGSH